MIVLKKETQQMTDDFGKMLKRLRVEQGLSLNDLSIKTGISSSYIYRLEQSKRKSVSFPKLVALSEALESNHGYLRVRVLTGTKERQ